MRKKNMNGLLNKKKSYFMFFFSFFFSQKQMPSSKFKERYLNFGPKHVTINIFSMDYHQILPNNGRPNENYFML